LVNGAIGIGTGFSTNIPCFNPKDIVALLKKKLDGEDISAEEITPWYNGFKGAIEKVGANKYVSRGIFKKTTATKVDILELPVGFWTQDFKEHIEEYMEKNQALKSYESHYTETDIKFTLNFVSGAVCDEYLATESNGYTKLENDFKLVSSKTLGTSNMYLFNKNCQIRKYESAVDIISDFYDVRLEYYQMRKDKLLAKLIYDIDLLRNKQRFIRECVAETIVVHKMKKDDLVGFLKANDYMLHEDSYDYILRIPIYNLTIDKVDEMEAAIKKDQDEIDRVSSLDIKDLWRDDIHKFEAEYKSIPVVTAGPKKKITKKSS
jgi:DNA topoisomerase-2